MDFVCNFPLLSILLCMISCVLCTLISPKQARRLTFGTEIAVLAMSTLPMSWVNSRLRGGMNCAAERWKR